MGAKAVWAVVVLVTLAAGGVWYESARERPRWGTAPATASAGAVAGAAGRPIAYQPGGSCTPVLVADLIRTNSDGGRFPIPGAVVVNKGCPAPAGFMKWYGAHPFLLGDVYVPAR